MICFGRASHAEKTRRHLVLPDGLTYHKSEWLETDTDPLLSPTVFLAEQGANTILRTHCHVQNEFQIVVAGNGSMGPHPLLPVTLHYAGAFTGYGPITAGPDGLSYFTVRAIHDTGALMIPEHRDQIKRGPKRQIHCTPFVPYSPTRIAELSTVEHVDLISNEKDLLAAKLSRIPPLQHSSGLDPAGSLGQFTFVIGGTLEYKGTTLKQWECLFVSGDEDAPSFRAGAAGVEILSLRMAHQAPEYLTT